ncbi:putative ribonuclease H-like domain-containing protein [Tanacetum coccineum]
MKSVYCPQPSVFLPQTLVVEKEVKPLYSRFVKAGEMHVVPPPITGTYMPSPYQSDIEETQVSYGSKSDNKTSDTISESNDFVSCDNSDKSSDSETYASCDSSLKTKTKDFPPAVDIQTLPESDVEDPNSTTGSPSFSCSRRKKNVKSPRIICNKSGMNNRNVCKNNFVRVKKCFVCGSKLHLIKDCDFYNCVDSVPCKSKAASVPAGSRNSSASVTADGSDPAASRNRPAVNSAGRPKPTERFGHPAGWSKRPAPVSAGSPVSADWLNPAARPYFRPSSVYFNNMYWHNFYDPMYMNKGRWGTAAQSRNGLVSSSCTNVFLMYDLLGSRCMSNLSGDGRISGKGTIKTSKLDFENVYYVEELQHFNLFSVSQICDKKNKVLFTDTDCLVLTEEFQLPDESQVVLRIPRERDLYTFNISELQPEQNVTCLVAKASSDESTRWHRRMAHVNFKTINKLAKEGPGDGFTSSRLCRRACEAIKDKEYEAKDCSWHDHGLLDPAGIVSADGVSAGSPSAGSDPAGGKPADSFEPADESNPAVSSSVSADFNPVYADESTLPPGQSCGQVQTPPRNHSVRCAWINSHWHLSHQGVNNNSSSVTDLGDLASPVPDKSRAQKPKFVKSAFIDIFKITKDQSYRSTSCLFEEMQQFLNQQVWKLVPLPNGKHAIGTKWILKNKRDARGIVVRNKARLVAQGHRQEEGIDYDEVFAPVARIEAIRLFLAFASYMGFLVYQMDVKSAFLYGEIEEEVYVTQPKGFEDPYFPKHVYRVVKALYGLHQAPRAWYARLSAFLLQHNYRRGTIDKTLFIKKDSRDIILVQVYVDDIIFGSTNKAWCAEFEVLMKGEFEMSAMGEMTFFLGLQVKQLPDGTFISQDRYVKDMLTKFDMESVRTATTPYEAAKTKLKDETDPPVNVHLYRSMIGSLMYLTASRPDIMFAVSACSRHQVTPLTSHLNAVKKIFKYLKGQPKLGLWYPKDSPFQLEAYSDSDYAGSHGDRKSTTGGCQFLGTRLISWQCKKQTIVATSSTEAEYVAAASCCAQVLWIQNQLLDYGFNFMNTKIFIDNQSTICIVKNPVFHQRTKHIEIRHHFIRDANEKNLIQVLKIHTDDNVADLLTKAFDGPRFAYLVVHIGMVDMLVAMDYAELVCAGSIKFLLTDLFLLVVTCFCCLNFVFAVLRLILLVGWSLTLVIWFLLVVSNHAGGTMYLLPE